MMQLYLIHDAIWQKNATIAVFLLQTPVAVLLEFQEYLRNQLKVLRDERNNV